MAGRVRDSGSGAPLGEGGVGADSLAAYVGGEGKAAGDRSESSCGTDGENFAGKVKQVMADGVASWWAGDDDVSAGAHQWPALVEQGVESGERGGVSACGWAQGGEEEVDAAGQSGGLRGGHGAGAAEDDHAVAGGFLGLEGGDVRAGCVPASVCGEADGVPSRAEGFDDGGAVAAVGVEHDVSGAGELCDGVLGDGRRHHGRVCAGRWVVATVGQLCGEAAGTGGPYRGQRQRDSPVVSMQEGTIIHRMFLPHLWPQRPSLSRTAVGRGGPGKRVAAPHQGLSRGSSQAGGVAMG